MKKRDFADMVIYFCQKVSEMDISQKNKMELLSMITAIEIGHDQIMPKWIPCSERLPLKSDHVDDMVLVCYGNGSIRFNTYMNGAWVQGNPIAWMQLPTPYRGGGNELH